jgi:hypothetical protein
VPCESSKRAIHITRCSLKNFIKHHSYTIATPQLLHQLLNHGISSVKTSINIHQAYCRSNRSLQKIYIYERLMILTGCYFLGSLDFLLCPISVSQSLSSSRNGSGMGMHFAHGLFVARAHLIKKKKKKKEERKM